MSLFIELLRLIFTIRIIFLLISFSSASSQPCGGLLARIACGIYHGEPVTCPKPVFQRGSGHTCWRDLSQCMGLCPSCRLSAGRASPHPCVYCKNEPKSQAVERVSVPSLHGPGAARRQPGRAGGGTACKMQVGAAGQGAYCRNRTCSELAICT